MLMLAGPVWVFSEAIMWGVASCAFVQYRLFRELEQSSARNQWWLGGALVFAVLNRPTLGLGCLLVVIIVAAVRSWRQRHVGPGEFRLAGLSALSLAVLIVPNMVRFGQPLGPPMELQLLSQVDEQRMEMLAYHLDGRPLSGDLCLDEIAKATQGRSASDIKFLVDEAARLALQADADVGTEHLLNAVLLNPLREPNAT